MSDSLYDLLKENGVHGRIPMHMPGHKRNAVYPYLQTLSAAEDITEIDGFDNLHQAEGILAEGMTLAAQLWGSRCSRFLVNGSSGGILAGIRAMTRRGDTVIVSRNAHRSVYHAIELCGLRPVFLMPPYDTEYGLAGSLPPAAVAEALAEHPEVTLVILTSPTYEGVVSDVSAIAAAAHASGAGLFVDEAHGAHFSFSGGFPQSAVRCGADLVVQSLHKTLPSLTQTAILHVCSERVDVARLDHMLSVFETSSPSYLLLSSMDGCVRFLREHPEIFAAWEENLAAFDTQISACRHIRIPGHSVGCRIENAYGYDRGKIFLSCLNLDADGISLAGRIREYGIEPEMCSEQGVLLMSGAGDTRETLALTGEIVCMLDAEVQEERKDVPLLPFVQSETRMPAETALEKPWQAVSPQQSIGCVAAEYIWAYPPGIPYLVPGEIVSEPFAAYVQQCGDRVRLHGTRTGASGTIAVCAHDSAGLDKKI